MTQKINEQESLVKSEEEIINKEKTKSTIKKAKTKTQRKEIAASQKSVIRNAIKRYDKRDIMMNAFINKRICSGDVEEEVYYWDEESKYEESIAKRAKMRTQNQQGQGLKI